ncbi:MAG: hypothetical protein HGB18_03275 [Candidatus Moranbacteria bacterium]|nr:hypothetical protein [Candidatus Moranbacteria bacterium]
MKKVFTVSIALFAVTLLFVGAYYLIFRKTGNTAIVDATKHEESRQETEQAFLEGATESDIVAVTDFAVIGATDLDESHLAYFHGRNLKRSTLGGGAEEILIDNLPGTAADASWSPDRSKVLVLLGTESGDRWHLVTLSDRKVTPLRNGISSPKWSNLSERIYYSYTDPGTGKAELDSAKPDGTDWKKISSLTSPTSFLQTIPSSATLSFWSRPSAFEETSMSIVPATGGEPRRIFSGKFGADYLWSPDGSKVLISNTVTKGGADVRLGIANRDGGEFRTLLVPTIVSKAVWSKDGKTVYYALPLSIPENSVLPNDYYNRPIHTQDSFWKIDTSTGKSERIIDPEAIGGTYDSIDPFMDQSQSYLFFTDRTSGKLFRIRLNASS